MTISNKKKPVIVGLAGTLASGKDTVAVLLTQNHEFLSVSTSDILRAAKKKAFGDSPQALLLRNDPFANELRARRGAGVLVELAYDEYQNKKNKYPGGLVVSGLRSIGEAEELKELGGVLIFVDADVKIRYQRAQSRNRDNIDSQVSFEDFVAMEMRESPVDSKDKVVQNLSALREMADLRLENNWANIEDFKRYTEKSLFDILG